MDFFEVQNLSFKYNDNWILQRISFQGKKGELIAIVGPSGCGKTTLLRIIVGILNPLKGKVILEQTNIIQMTIEKRRIGYVPQHQALFPHLTVFANIAFGLQAQKRSKDEINRRVLELAKLGEIEDMLKRKPHELSGGQQQRVALLRALAPSPKLLLLDEPLSNIDANLRENLAIYIKNIQKFASITTLFVTHDLNEAKMLADKLVILNRGQIIQIGSPWEVSLNPESVEAAKTVGLKNLFSILAIARTDDMNKSILSTEFGKILIQTDKSNNFDKEAKTVYIDPTKIKISKKINSGTFEHKGEIITIIPDFMIHQATLLVKIETTKFPLSSYQILRVQIPISEKNNFKISDQVNIEIPSSALRFFQ